MHLIGKYKAETTKQREVSARARGGVEVVQRPQDSANGSSVCPRQPEEVHARAFVSEIQRSRTFILGFFNSLNGMIKIHRPYVGNFQLGINVFANDGGKGVRSRLIGWRLLL